MVSMVVRALALALFVIGCGGGGESGSSHNVTIDVVGPGSVTSTPIGIDCPTGGCTSSFSDHVTLYAQPAANATFVGWSGACSGTSQSCMLQLDGDKTATAMFAAGGMHMLSVTVNGPGTVTSTPAGISCSSGTCTAMFDDSVTVTLNQTGLGSATFAGWTGACSGTGTCSVQMTQDRSVTASFASTGYVLSVHLEGDGTGTVTSNPSGIHCTTGSSTGCSYDFGPSAGPITITATPDSNSSFTGQGSMGNYGCAGNHYGNPCSYNLDSNGLAVNVGFSGWTVRHPFPSSLTGFAMIGTGYVAVGGGGDAITSTNDSAGGNGSYWTGRPAPDAMNALTTQNMTWYAARDGGYVAASPDGVTWTDHAAGTNNLLGIASSGTQLVAVGANGAIEYSANGTSWSAATSGTTVQLDEVIYAGGQFVAIGFAGTIRTSPDGVTWTARTSGTTAILDGIAYSGTQYVIVGADGLVLTSPDAITWTKPTTSGLPVAAIRGIAWTGTTFIAAGDPFDSTTGRTFAYTSTNGTTWTAHLTAMYDDPATRVVAAGDGYVYLLGQSGSLQRTVDASSWSLLLAPGGRGVPGNGQSNALYSVAYNGTVWVAVGAWGSIFTSPDAVTWTSRRVSPAPDVIFAVEWGAGLATPVFAAVGSDASFGGAIYVLTSPDGITWTKRFPASGTLPGTPAGIAYGGPTKGFSVVGSYLTTSYQGFAITSLDGITWSTSPTAPTDITSNLQYMTYGNGQFVATGFTPSGGTFPGAVYTSPDGATWTAQAISATSQLGPVAYGNGGYTALESQGMGVWTSANGTQWTRSAVTFTPGHAMVFGNGIFYDSALYTSANGTTWSQVSRLPDFTQIDVNDDVFTAARYGAGMWVGVTTNEGFVTHH